LPENTTVVTEGTTVQTSSTSTMQLSTVTTAAVPTTTSGGPLPVTGSGAWPPLLGVTALGFGGGLWFVSRRRPSTR